MKKFIQVSIVVILALALIVGFFQIGFGGELPQAGNSCRVGWNTKAGNCLVMAPMMQGPTFRPNVGWNS